MTFWTDILIGAALIAALVVFVLMLIGAPMLFASIGMDLLGGRRRR
ncbi:hypothetical protein [Lysobacter arvi]|uniref:TRAP transporter large permease subunit n=1 Tax=Lysobacter arvi TaxID=3038776 RepID=A0ABU1CCC5_9GAMM|nr:hypothetical protein [Lysobacter arvi]MDR0182417.1 hypothetical protein [Lysobacter arvi]